MSGFIKQCDFNSAANSKPLFFYTRIKVKDGQQAAHTKAWQELGDFVEKHYTGVYAMIKCVDKDDPNYARTFVACSSNDTYLDWSEDSMAVDGSEIKNLSLAMMQYYEDMEGSTQEVWTDDVQRLKDKYDSYGLPMNYIDMNQVLGKVNLSKGEKYTGQCYCGSCKFELTGEPIMNALCHCPWCSKGLGMCPVHLRLMADGNYKITGEEHIKVFKGNGKLRFGKCTKCGCSVYQGPEGANFKAFYPRMFDGYISGSTGKSNKLPADLQHKLHVNYENRLWDWNDGKPKFAAFPPNDPLNDDGSAKE